MRRLMLVGLLIAASHVEAQERPRVFVSHSGTDVVGGQLAYQVREEIRRSAGYQLGTSDKYLLRISIVSLDLDKDSGGNWSTVSVAYSVYNYQPLKAGDPETWLPILLNHSVHTVGVKRTEETAKSIVANLEQEWEDFKESASQSAAQAKASQ